MRPSSPSSRPTERPATSIPATSSISRRRRVRLLRRAGRRSRDPAPRHRRRRPGRDARSGSIPRRAQLPHRPARLPERARFRSGTGAARPTPDAPAGDEQQARAVGQDLPRVRRPARSLGRGRRRERDPHHRLALLPRRHRVAGVRESLPSPPHVDRPRRRGRPRCVARERRRAVEGHADRHHAHRCAAPADARRVRRGARHDLPPDSGLVLRPCRRRYRARGPRGRGVRRIRRTRHDLARLGCPRRSGCVSSRIENYVGFPNGVSGEDLTQAAAIQAIRLGARLERAVRSGRSPRRERLPRDHPRRRERDPDPLGDRRVGRALPPARGRRSRALRRRGRVLRRDRHGSARFAAAST